MLFAPSHGLLANRKRVKQLKDKKLTSADDALTKNTELKGKRNFGHFQQTTAGSSLSVLTISPSYSKHFQKTESRISLFRCYCAITQNMGFSF